MDESDKLCPNLHLPDDAFWKEVNPGFGQESWDFAIYFKYDEEAKLYRIRADANASGYYEDEGILEHLPDEIRVNIGYLSWGGLSREVPSGAAVTDILQANSELLESMLNDHDVRDGSFSEEGLDMLTQLEAAFEEAAEYEEFWLIEEHVKKLS